MWSSHTGQESCYTACATNIGRASLSSKASRLFAFFRILPLLRAFIYWLAYISDVGGSVFKYRTRHLRSFIHRQTVAHIQQNLGLTNYKINKKIKKEKLMTVYAHEILLSSCSQIDHNFRTSKFLQRYPICPLGSLKLNWRRQNAHHYC